MFNSLIIQTFRVKEFVQASCAAAMQKGSFFMSNQVHGINNNIAKAGTCPHGLAPGACPVCSMSGGGTLKMSDKTRKVGEMTYHECAMIGNMLRARALAQKNHEMNLKLRAINAEQFEALMTKLSAKIAQFVNFMSQNILTKPIAFAAKIILMPIINIISSLPSLINGLLNNKFISKIFSPVFDICDKLAAIFGEAKAFLNKKLEEAKKLIKSALDKLFKIFKKQDADDDDTKIDDDKRIFNLKNIINKIRNKQKKDGDDELGS